MGDLVHWDGITTLDLPPERVLAQAAEANLDRVFVMGFDKEGEPYFGSSCADGGTMLWLIEVCKARLMGVAGEPK